MTALRWMTLALALAAFSAALSAAAIVLIVLGLVHGQALLDPYGAAAGWCLAYSALVGRLGDRAEAKADGR